MQRTHGRVIDVTSLADFDRRLVAGPRSLAGWRIHGLDLSGHTDRLVDLDVRQALFMGCTFADGVEQKVRERGAVVVPALRGNPLSTARSSLYSPQELYDAANYADSLDARAYAWTRQQPDQDDALAVALHDFTVDQALASWVQDRSIVGVMGGHGLERGSDGYADAAALGHALGAHRTIATGGGPGAMEAANLGAFLAESPPDAVSDALARLARVPSFTPSIGAWADVALDIVREHGPGVDSLGIPTWFYGHEPPNVFATAIAKYVRNATREAILLEVCTGGIVFLPGAGGTVQEIFQDACENYYADASSLAPMILVGVEHWTSTLPAWPLLQSLARGRAMEQTVHLVDTVDEAVDLLLAAG